MSVTEQRTCDGCHYCRTRVLITLVLDECRRNAPVLVPEQHGHHGVFPVINRSKDWCAEWRARSEWA